MEFPCDIPPWGVLCAKYFGKRKSHDLPGSAPQGVAKGEIPKSSNGRAGGPGLLDTGLSVGSNSLGNGAKTLNSDSCQRPRGKIVN